MADYPRNGGGGGGQRGYLQSQGPLPSRQSGDDVPRTSSSGHSGQTGGFGARQGVYGSSLPSGRPMQDPPYPPPSQTPYQRQGSPYQHTSPSSQGMQQPYHQQHQQQQHQRYDDSEHRQQQQQQAAYQRQHGASPSSSCVGTVNSSSTSCVGWGGKAITETRGNHHVPWFGRNKSKNPRGPPDGRGRGSYDPSRKPPAPPAAGYSHASEDAMSVEAMVSLIQRLPKREPLPEVIFRALYHLDSRGVALMLKELSRGATEKRAVQVFDYLRGLPQQHALRPLCDVYTYTAMVSLCNSTKDVDRALELVEEMRRLNIERNVHTYTALMNVCIKCGKLPKALDTFEAMRSSGCLPNVVTYNTLIDVYGKLGHWERAVQVIDMMKHEGSEPVLRTYNTLIIACNMCNQPRESLLVYHRLQQDGHAPSSTTFNALISAYGKTGQLDMALETYQEMHRQNMERSVITYSSLISACEKAGQWETALNIFKEMQQDGCPPNTVTYNSLIAACGQGGKWEKSKEVFDEMSLNSCAPDVVTYTALISAYERGGEWQGALQAFHQMCLQGCRPDAIVFNAIIDTLWSTGVVWAQAKALSLFATALQQGQFRQEPIVSSNTCAELVLHAMTAGVAMLSLYCWLQDVRRMLVEKGVGALPPIFIIVTDAGKASREQGNFIVKDAVSAMMSFWDAPFRVTQHSLYTAALEASREDVAEWLMSEAYSAQLASLFPISEAAKSKGSTNAGSDVSSSRESRVLEDCAEAFSAVAHFESTHGLVLPNMSAAFIQQRPTLISRLLDVSSRLGLRDEVVHDAVLLMDRTASQAKQVSEDVLPLVCVAALVIASKQGESSDKLPTNLDIEYATDCPADAVAKMEWNVRGLLSDDTAAISTMRCLKVYLERLGFRFLDKQGVYGMAGFAIMLAVESLYDVSLLNCRPSVVAAALLYSERRLRGAVPFWPSMLAKLTGYEDMASPELMAAVRVAHKLSRKPVYSQMYKAQLMALSPSIPKETPAASIPDQLNPIPADWSPRYDVQSASAAAMAAAMQMDRDLESLSQAGTALPASASDAMANICDSPTGSHEGSTGGIPATAAMARLLAVDGSGGVSVGGGGETQCSLAAVMKGLSVGEVAAVTTQLDLKSSLTIA